MSSWESLVLRIVHLPKVSSIFRQRRQTHFGSSLINVGFIDYRIKDRISLPFVESQSLGAINLRLSTFYQHSIQEERIVWAGQIA